MKRKDKTVRTWYQGLLKEQPVTEWLTLYSAKAMVAGILFQICGTATKKEYTFSNFTYAHICRLLPNKCCTNTAILPIKHCTDPELKRTYYAKPYLRTHWNVTSRPTTLSFLSRKQNVNITCIFYHNWLTCTFTTKLSQQHKSNTYMELFL